MDTGAKCTLRPVLLSSLVSGGKSLSSFRETLAALPAIRIVTMLVTVSKNYPYQPKNAARLYSFSIFHREVPALHRIVLTTAWRDWAMRGGIRTTGAVLQCFFGEGARGDRQDASQRHVSIPWFTFANVSQLCAGHFNTFRHIPSVTSAVDRAIISKCTPLARRYYKPAVLLFFRSDTSSLYRLPDQITPSFVWYVYSV